MSGFSLSCCVLSREGIQTWRRWSEPGKHFWRHMQRDTWTDWRRRLHCWGKNTMTWSSCPILMITSISYRLTSVLFNSFVSPKSTCGTNSRHDTNNISAHFPQSWQSLSAPTGYEDLSKVILAPHHTFDNAKKAIAELKAQLEDISKEELSKISSAGEQTFIFQTSAVKGIVHLEMKLTHHQVVPNRYQFLSSVEHCWRMLAKLRFSQVVKKRVVRGA